MWEHPHDITSLSSIQFSIYPHSSPSSVNSCLCSALQKPSTASHHSDGVSPSISVHLRLLQGILSLPPSLSTSASLMALFRAPASGAYSASHPLPTLPTNQWQNRQTSRDLYKEASFISQDPVTFHYSSRHIKKEEPTPRHQEGRNYAQLPGCDASWTGHFTAQQSTLLSSTRPCNCTSLSRYNSLWTSGLSAPYPVVHHHLWPTGGLCISQQPSSTLQPSSLGKPNSRHQD